MYFETSAKTALNVSKAFDEVAKQLFMSQLERRRESRLPQLESSPKNENVSLNETQEASKNGCC